MEKCNISRKYSTGYLKFFGISLGIAVLMMTMLALTSERSLAATPKPGKPGDSILSECRADLAKRLKIDAKDISLSNMEREIWPSTALGMPEIGKVYAQVRTPGDRIILKARNTEYLYTTGAKAFRYGGPLGIWSYSMMYLQPVRNDPNLNGDLYQCSLIGTNSVRLASEITDYYPQNDGTILLSRRTSRSSFDLLYVKADNPCKEKMLHHAFAYGDAAADYAHDRWGALVKPHLGGVWVVVMGSFEGKGSAIKTLPIPEDTFPGEIAWSGDRLMITVKRGNGLLAFATNPSEESPIWKQINTYEFPGQNRFMLNKSESLEISQVQDSAKPEVEIARVWFTGDRNVVAKIPDFTMEAYDLLGSYAFVWGHKGSHPAAYSVDIRTGDTVVSYPGEVSNIKPFAYPPHDSPIPPAPKIE